MIHPRTLRRLHRRLSLPHRLSQLTRAFLDAEPDHTHVLALIAELSTLRSFLALCLLRMGADTGHLDRMAEDIDAAARMGHARGVRDKGGVLGAMMRWTRKGAA